MLKKSEICDKLEEELLDSDFYKGGMLVAEPESKLSKFLREDLKSCFEERGVHVFYLDLVDLLPWDKEGNVPDAFQMLAEDIGIEEIPISRGKNLEKIRGRIEEDCFAVIIDNLTHVLKPSFDENNQTWRELHPSKREWLAQTIFWIRNLLDSNYAYPIISLELLDPFQSKDHLFQLFSRFTRWEPFKERTEIIRIRTIEDN